MGAIDEGALSHLAFVAGLAKNVRVRAAAGGGAPADSAEDLARCLPAFGWVLRDFALLLRDEDGNGETGAAVGPRVVPGSSQPSLPPPPRPVV
jgi:hypothetical protein